MNEIIKIESGQNRYSYFMKSNCNFGDVNIEVEAEIDGHECLFGIKLPKFSIKGFCWSGSNELPEMNDVMHVYNKILEDYHCSIRVSSISNQI